MLPVPAFAADAGAVGAEAVGVAAVVALQLVTQGPCPPAVADAALVTAVAVYTLQTTHLWQHGSTNTRTGQRPRCVSLIFSS